MKRRVSDPVVSVRLDKHTETTVYLLPDKADRMTKPGAKTTISGPCLVIAERVGPELKVRVYSLKNPQPWRWLDQLAQAGVWALSDRHAAPFLPDHLLARSPRFSGTTQEQRKRKATDTR